MGRRLQTTRVAQPKPLPREQEHRAQEARARAISGTSGKAPLASGTRFTRARRAACSGAFNTPTSTKWDGRAEPRDPRRLLRRPWTTWWRLPSATTCPSLGRRTGLKIEKRGAARRVVPFFLSPGDSGGFVTGLGESGCVRTADNVSDI